MDAVWNGLRRGDAVRKIGGQPDRIMDAVRPKGAHHAYLELHIEQGGTLDRDRVAIGVVEGIVGIKRYTATIRFGTKRVRSVSRNGAASSRDRVVATTICFGASSCQSSARMTASIETAVMEEMTIGMRLSIAMELMELASHMIL